LIIGLIAGLLLPVLTAWFIYSLRYEGNYEFQDFMRGLIVLKSLGKLISISVLPNLAVFMLAVTFERLLFARGLVFATFFWVIVVLLIKFIL
jgi:hypothetical protein